VYNWDVRRLIESLVSQAQTNALTCEIICLDDASDEHWKPINREIAHLPNVNYQELTFNHGRARIRNELARRAQYEQLLFLDCDTLPRYSDFLSKYYALTPDNEAVICGGHVYSSVAPQQDELYLHWHYGSKRESLRADQRSRNAYKSFMTSNFMAPRSVLLQVGFDENLRGYGHEDTLFGLALEKQNVKIMHIENPLIHEGLEENRTFLNKSRAALRNLSFIDRRYPQIMEVKILKLAKILRWLRLDVALIWLFAKLEKPVLRNLYSRRPNLRFYDWYRLVHLCLLLRENSTLPHNDEKK
jgi:hypothetical protein